jgi:uncharacterized protein (DUF952 family)
LLYHIATEKDWAAAEFQTEYKPSTYNAEGFIHASRFHQLGGVLERYYANRSDLLLLKIDEQKLACQVIYEPSAAKELFPHIYGGVEKGAIVDVIKPFNLSVFESLNSFR